MSSAGSAESEALLRHPGSGCVCHMELRPLFRSPHGLCALAQEPGWWRGSRNLPPAHLRPPRPFPPGRSRLSRPNGRSAPWLTHHLLGQGLAAGRFSFGSHCRVVSPVETLMPALHQGEGRATFTEGTWTEPGAKAGLSFWESLGQPRLWGTRNVTGQRPGPGDRWARHLKAHHAWSLQLWVPPCRVPRPSPGFPSLEKAAPVSSSASARPALPPPLPGPLGTPPPVRGGPSHRFTSLSLSDTRPPRGSSGMQSVLNQRSRME